MHLKKLDDQTVAFWVPALVLFLMVLAIPLVALVMIQGKVFVKSPTPAPAVMIEVTTAPESKVEVAPVVHEETTPLPIRYQVKDGDTLHAIAKEFCVDYLVLARENNIKNPNRIYAGKTVLQVRNGCTSAPSVLVKQNVSPRELVQKDEASSGKHVFSQSEGSSLPSPDTLPPTSVVTDRPISEMYHQEIYRIVDLGKLGKLRTAAQTAELMALRQIIRSAVFIRYGHLLKNVDCLYDDKLKMTEQILCIRENYGDRLTEVAKARNVPRDYLEALILIESGGKPDAISSEGCAGVKQFCLRTSRGYGLTDRFDPVASIDAGARHLSDNLHMWSGDMAKALLHYGEGIAAARRADAGNTRYVRTIAQVVKVIRRLDS